MKKIKATGTELKTIYINHSDPDFYFGLQALREAFPKSKIVATKQTIDHINKTKDNKLKIWEPQLKTIRQRRL